MTRKICSRSDNGRMTMRGLARLMDFALSADGRFSFIVQLFGRRRKAMCLVAEKASVAKGGRAS